MCLTANSTAEWAGSICQVVVSAIGPPLKYLVKIFLATTIVKRSIMDSGYVSVTQKGDIMAGRLKKEIQQKKPFASLQEEVILTMMRTLDTLIAPGVEVLRAADLSQSQYNVLRIL